MPSAPQGRPSLARSFRAGNARHITFSSPARGGRMRRGTLLPPLTGLENVWEASGSRD